MRIHPNAYYYYKRNHQKTLARKKASESINNKISKIYHDNHGGIGYRQVKKYLEKSGIILSFNSVHWRMCQVLGLKSLARKKKPNYRYGKAHKIFKNLLKQKFFAKKKNRKWCTDFTYLYLKNGEVRYNCTIIDLHDRSVVASITDRNITADLAIRTLKKALLSQDLTTTNLILHSDQGSQFTSKEFIDYCDSIGIRQSMSKAGYPYDNAPMERYFNTLKNEYINLHEYTSEKQLYNAVTYFAYTKYNRERPHEYNNYKTPMEARCA